MDRSHLIPPPPKSAHTPSTTHAHSLFHLNCNSLFKAKQSKTLLYTDSNLTDDLYNNITKHNLVSLVDTRTNSDDVERLKQTFQNKYHIFATSSHLSPPRAEVAILIAKTVTDTIYKTYTYKQSSEDGNRALVIIYHDKILNAKTLVANFYTPPGKRTIFIPQILSYFTNKIHSNSPSHIIIMSDANIRLDKDNLTTTKQTSSFLWEHHMQDAYRFKFPNKVTHPGYTYPPKPNTNNDPTRIDYAFMSTNLLKEDYNFELIPNSILNTDHLAISINFSNARPREYSYRFRDRFLDNQSFIHNLEIYIRCYLERIIKAELLGQDYPNLNTLSLDQLSTMLPDHFISFDGLNDLILNTAKKLDYQYRKYELNQSKQIHLRDQAEYLQLLSKSSQLTNQERQRTEYLANKMKSFPKPTLILII